ncbi:hypothetical protein ACTXT7_007452 [Hymenolepis weldensis]
MKLSICPALANDHIDLPCPTSIDSRSAPLIPTCRRSCPILSVEDDPNWYLAEQDGRKGLVPCNYISFRPNPWYMQACRRNTAEECLLETDPHTGLPVQPDGAFVVRRSESNGPGFSLSVNVALKEDIENLSVNAIMMHGECHKVGDTAAYFLCFYPPTPPLWDGQKVQHFKVLQDEMGKYFVWLRKFDSINQLIEYHRRTSISRDSFLLLVDRQPSRGDFSYLRSSVKTFSKTVIGISSAARETNSVHRIVRARRKCSILASILGIKTLEDENADQSIARLPASREEKSETFNGLGGSHWDMACRSNYDQKWCRCQINDQQQFGECNPKIGLPINCCLSMGIGGGNQQSQMVQRVIARFDFNASEAEELSFHRGDVIEVLGQEDENWWRGRISTTGATGLFPANYVDTLPPIMPQANSSNRINAN